MLTRASTTSPETCADAVTETFAAVFDLVNSWRSDVENAFGERVSASVLDDFVADRVLPVLGAAGGITGAGFIASPEFVGKNSVHFAWWLGPLDAGPIFGSTTDPTRLDLSTRGHADYLRDVRSQEWWALPASTHSGHVTGPYVDHLCTCDYILTLSVPAHRGGRMTGVVGADISVAHLESAVIGLFLACENRLVLVNALGRVVVSAEPRVAAGTLLRRAVARTLPCAGTGLAIAVLA